VIQANPDAFNDQDGQSQPAGKPTAGQVRRESKGRWPEILRHFAPDISDAVESIGSTKHHPCPVHGGTDGFRLFDDAADSGGGVCNSCGSKPDGFYLLSWLLNRDFESVMDDVGEFLGVKKRGRGRPKGSTKGTTKAVNSQKQKPSTPPISAKEVSLQRAKILARYREAIPDTGRIAAYLRSRGLSGTVPTGLKFLPLAQYFESSPDGSLQPSGTHHAMISLVEHPTLGPVALHRTYLSLYSDGKADVPSPKKLTPPIYKGAITGAAIRLYYATDHVSLTEGIETAIAVHEALSGPDGSEGQKEPVWATITAGGLESIELPPTIKTVTIWADNDENETGQKAAEAAAARLTSHGIEVRIVTPPNPGEDWLEIYSTDGDGALRAALDSSTLFAPLPEDPTNVPKIVIHTKEHLVIDEAVRALSRDPLIYQRGGRLVRVCHESIAERGKIERPPNAPRISELPKPSLSERLTSVANWVTVKVVDGEEIEKPAHPPRWAVEGTHCRGQWQGVRHLESVIETPVFCPDGSILSTPGYHPPTGLLFESSTEFPTIPESPTQADAIQAAADIANVVVDFPFSSPAHLSAWVASVITPLARFAFAGPAPLFLVDANVRGAGKSILVDLASLVTSGREMARMVNSQIDEEMRKRITAIAISGDLNCLIDNVSDTLGCPSLDAVLTASTWKDRILGKSESTPDLPLITTWYATGNNVIIKGDLSRRTLHVRLESPDENPEERANFTHENIKTWTFQNRPRLVAAVLTLLRAYHVAGRPDQHLKPWGSFEGWSRLVRHSLVWAGMSDPGETRQELVLQADTDATALRNLIDGFEQLDPFSHGRTVSEILRACQKPDSEFETDTHEQLREAILELTSARTNMPSSNKVGKMFKKMKGRVISGKCLDVRLIKNNSQFWVIRKLDNKNGECGDTWELPNTPCEKSKLDNSSVHNDELNNYTSHIGGLANSKQTPHSPPATEAVDFL